MDTHPDQKINVLLKFSHLPLVQSALHSVTSAYSGVKDRFPLLGLMGGAAEVGVRGLSEEALRRAAPFLQNLEPQIAVANSLALDGLDHLERNFPILNQSTEEVITHLKDAFFLTLDDVQIRVVEGLDGVLDQLEHLVEIVWTSVQQLQNTQVGQAASFGLDNALSRLEDATAYYLPLPPTLRREWEMRVQEYEEEDGDDEEPSVWTRVRSLLLTLSLQLYHRMSKVRGHLEEAVRSLGRAADRVGLSWILELTGELLQNLQNLLVALLFRAESMRETTLWEIKNQASMLAELIPVRQVGELPVQIQQVLRDLQELSKILLQLVVNTTPLYSVLELPSPQELEDFLNQEDFVLDGSSRRSSTNSLFLKAMDGRPRRRRSLYARANRGSGPQSPEPPNDRRSSMKESSNPDVEGMTQSSEGNTFRRPSATELLLTPLKQFVSQSQKAFEYLSPNSTSNDAIVTETDDF